MTINNQTQDNTIVVRGNKFNIILYAIGSLIFVFIGLSMLNAFSVIMHILAIITILFFGYAFIIYTKRLFQDRPLLTVNNNGLTDHSSEFSLGFIPWDDITKIDLMDIMGQTYITVSLKNQQEYFNKMTLPQKILTRINLALGFAFINITLNTSGKKPQAIYQKMQTQFSQFLENNH